MKPSGDPAMPYRPVPVTDVQLAFPADVSELIPDWEDIPSEHKDPGGLYSQEFSTWFFHGIAPGTECHPVPGIDAREAFRHVVAIMRSFQPKHEHKEAACRYLMSLWFERIASP